MIQLIVYTGFYWAVKVMESLLLVNSTTALRSSSALSQHFAGPRSPGGSAGPPQTADAHNLWPWWVSCFLKNHAVPRRGSVPNCGVPLLIKLQGKKGRRTSMFTPTQIIFDWHRRAWGRWRSMMGGQVQVDGETIDDLEISCVSKCLSIALNWQINPNQIEFIAWYV